MDIILLLAIIDTITPDWRKPMSLVKEFFMFNDIDLDRYDMAQGTVK